VWRLHNFLANTGNTLSGSFFHSIKIKSFPAASILLNFSFIRSIFDFSAFLANKKAPLAGGAKFKGKKT
jgi:hypothetical protein